MRKWLPPTPLAIVQRTAVAFLIAVLPAFIALKIGEVHRESVNNRTSLTFTTTVGHGLQRRLDDPSFWAIFACATSAIFVTRASKLAGTSGKPSRFIFYLGWLVVGVSLSILYAKVVCKDHETFCHPSTDRIIKTIQWAEGAIIVAVILLTPMFLALGLQSVGIIRRGLSAANRDENHRRSAGDLASAGAMPFVTATIALGIGTVIVWAGGKADVFGYANVKRDVLAMMFYALPFIVLLAVVRLGLRRCFRFKFRSLGPPEPFGVILLILGVGALSAGGYYEAHWKTLEGCPNPAPHDQADGVVELG